MKFALALKVATDKVGFTQDRKFLVRGERGGHAATCEGQGSTCSSTANWSSVRSEMLSCFHPVLRNMWIARERAGVRLSPKIWLA